MKKHLMNQMNLMNLFSTPMCIKKIFFDMWAGIGLFLGTSRFIGLFCGCFTLISINKLLKIGSLDVSNVYG